jgi:predicted nucleotidyltransferase
MPGARKPLKEFTMDHLRINFERLRNEGLKPVLDAVERVFTDIGIDFYLIGATARDVWINHISFRNKRTTRDIDFCVYVKDLSQYKEAQRRLIEKEGFTRDKSEPYRMYAPDGHMIDLIPFGGIEQHDSVFLDDPPVELSVFGTKEVTDNSVAIDDTFKVITLPGLCILKLIAWNDKPDRRGKDLDDFYFLLHNYFDICGEQLYDEPFDDLLTNDFQPQLAAARMLGRQMDKILDESHRIRNKVLEILPQLLKGFTDIEIDQLYEANQSDVQIVGFRMVVEVIKGIRDRSIDV